MKKYIFITLLFISFNTLAQESVLQVTKIKSGRTKTIRQGKKIKVYTKGFTVKGKLTILNDSTIIIKGTPMPLNQITRIKNKNIITQIFSILAPPMGSMLIVGSLTGSHNNGIDGEIFIPGLITLTTGILSTQIYTNHKTPKYTFRIIKR